jgi:outer membrane biosynthesis protein TonB
MKFIKLESRGGNYLVVAENVAWLRTGENGQTSVGIIGGQPLLVVGTIEGVAAKILAGSGPDEQPAAEPSAPPAVVAPVAAPTPAPVAAEPAVPAPVIPEPIADAPIVEAQVEPAHSAQPEPPVETPEPAIIAPKAERRPQPTSTDRPRPAPAHSMSLSERVARAAAPKVRAGTQRFMGMSE